MSDTQTLARRHLGASLALFDALERAAGGHPAAARVRAFLDHPERIPVTREAFAMKYDGYIAVGTHAAWGFTLNSRYEDRPTLDLLDEAVAAAGTRLGAPLMNAVARLADALPRPGVTTIAFAFERKDAAPRLKVYLQEDRWGEGVGSAREVDAALDACGLGCRLPAWVEPSASVGVVTLEAPPERPLRAKAYLGAAGLEGAFAGAPSDVAQLAARMQAACPLPSTYYYLTLRLERDAPVRYAVNKIYDLAAQGFGADAAATLGAFRDLAGLFRAAGKTRELRSVLGELRRPVAGGRVPLVIPTASAIEDEGRSVDFYCAAFAMGDASRGAD